MKKQLSPRYVVNYDTKWIHTDLNPEHYLYFKAKTPIQEIIPELKNRLNQNKPSYLKIDYEASFMTTIFSRLYRNLIGSYKGWQVLYREPASKMDYHSIREKIGYQEMAKKTGNLKQILSRRMVWNHNLYPGIQPVEINRPSNCTIIAKILNHHFSTSNLNPLLQDGLVCFENLNQNCSELMQQNLKLTVLTSQNHQWQSFLNNLERLDCLRKQLQVLNSKDYTIYNNNVYDVLRKRYQTAKGWRVELFDQNP